MDSDLRTFFLQLFEGRGRASFYFAIIADEYLIIHLEAPNLDTLSKTIVGSGCYVIGSLPSAGTIAKFDTFSAEFVGTPTL